MTIWSFRFGGKKYGQMLYVSGSIATTTLFPQLFTLLKMIRATIIAASISPANIPIYTLELEYPRFIHSELMTHKVLSKNAASSRAIPMKAMWESILADTAMPVEWGKNQPGMQADHLVDETTKEGAIGVWLAARDAAIAHARVLSDMGIHKQICNRLTEPFMNMKTVITGTEWDNFLELRTHKDAQPEFRELARKIEYELNDCDPFRLEEGEWHVPYVGRARDMDGVLHYFTENTGLSVEEARKVSASCCAQVSYRKNDDSLEKALAIYDRLVGSTPKHSSPFEHQATPIKNVALTEDGTMLDVNEKGITAISTKSPTNYEQEALWSNNFRGWIQHRAILD